MKYITSIGFLIALVGGYLLLADPAPKYDFTEFNKVEREAISNIRSELGLYCSGTGAAALQGVIRSWNLAFISYGIPSEDEALALLHRAREIAEYAFRNNPAVLERMHPDYVEKEKFGIDISFRNLDGSYPKGAGVITDVHTYLGKVEVLSFSDGPCQVLLAESYEDFLKRFPDTTLSLYRPDMVDANRR